MSFNVPPPKNEPVLSYAPNTPERTALQAEMDRRLRARIDAPMWIAGHAIETKDVRKMSPPQMHAHNLGNAHFGEAKHVRAAIDAALKAKRDWENMPFEERGAIMLKAADLISGPYRAQIDAATMLGQGRTASRPRSMRPVSSPISCASTWPTRSRCQDQPISSPAFGTAWNTARSKASCSR